MATEYKFFYARGTTKRSFLLASNQLQGVVNNDVDTIKFEFENIGLNRDSSDSSTVTFDITSGNAKQFVKDVFEHHAKNAFTVIADEGIESVGADYGGATVTIDSEIG